jgi:uncharacterized membrane protein YccC
VTVTKIHSFPRARRLLFGRGAITRRELLFELVIGVILVSIAVVIGKLIWGGSWVSVVVIGVVIALAGWGGQVHRYRRLAKSS